MPNNEEQKPAILLIGPLPHSSNSATNVIGGNKVMVLGLVHELGSRGFEMDAIDTSGDVTNLPAWKIQAARLVRFLRVVWEVMKKIRRFHLVFLLIAPYSALILASSVWMICKITRRPMVLRFSGFGLAKTYRNYGAVARWLADHTYMRASLIYVETQELCRQFNNPANFRWFPNTRDIKVPAVVSSEEPPAEEGKADQLTRRDISKLIFVAQLHMTKGLAEALDACRHLPENCHLNVFGPPMSDTDFSGFEGHPRATYGGVLKREEIPRVMSEHDLLLFPSYCRDEGIPGSILEAFQCGLPVIAASWGGVPEIVEHEENGLLVEPRSATALKTAIERLLEDPDLYQGLCAGAERRGEDFRNTNWYDRAASELHNLCR